VRCPLCGHRFGEEEGWAACQGCPLARNCQRRRCPNCGYDVPLEPKLVKILKAWRRWDDGARGKSGRAA